jgi:hypothetical protein
VAVAISLLCAVVAALAYGIGSVLQAAAASRAEKRPNLDAMLLVRLVGELAYLAGLGLDLVGFVASVVALQTLPLFLVQSAIAGSVGVTAVTASIAFGIVLERYEKVALVGLMVGFALLAVAAEPGEATALSQAGRWVLFAGVGAVVLIGLVGARFDDRRASIVLAIGAGLSWAGTGVAARVLQVPSPLWHLLVDPVAVVLAAYGVIGTLLFATALQRGSVTAAAALVFSVETIIPSAIGLAFLGDQARPGFAGVALVGVVATVGSSIALARRSEPLPRSDSGLSDP